MSNALLHHIRTDHNVIQLALDHINGVKNPNKEGVIGILQHALNRTSGVLEGKTWDTELGCFVEGDGE